MYFQPYGDDQQLNLNWIINEIINLHKQLDPDYETPSFTQVYPYSNLNRINLDWILSELKALKELAPEPTPTIDIQAVAEALVALPFDSNTSYQIYDFISRDGEIWRATEAIAAGGVWDETKWFKTKIGTDLAVLERWINAINNSLTSLQNTVADLSSIDISDDSDAGGATVKASLNNLKSAVDTLENDLDGLTSADISDDSDAGGATVKASLNNLKSAVDGLTSADISDDSDAGGETVKANLNLLKGSLNTKVDEKATAITSLATLSDDSLFFAATDNIAIGSTGVTIPQYARGVFINYNSNEAGLLAVTLDGNLIWAFRVSGTWTEADSSANVYTTITNSNPFLERTSNATDVDLTANSYTQLTTISLEAGTWLINVYTWLSDTGTDFYNSNISSNYGNRTCIFPAYNGGSNNNTMTVTFPSTQTVTVNVFYARAIKASCELTAIRLNKGV